MKILGYIFLFIIIVLHSYRTYQSQVYWLDKLIARFIRYLKSLWRKR
ncbi:hypothetical protein ABIB62_003767 [Mucilaginibacter sp. UYP25]